MEYWKKILFVALSIVSLYFISTGFSEQNTSLFFFPTLAVSFFLSFNLYKQNSKENDALLKEQLQTVAQNSATEKWTKMSFAPDAMTYIKANRWMIILLSFLSLVVVTFFWSYLANGYLIALRDFAYAAILFWSFIMYLLFVPSTFSYILFLMPKAIQTLFKNDWAKGYVFLLPITFYVYLLFPYEKLVEEFSGRLGSFPLFFLVYSAFFLCTSSLVLLYESIQADEHSTNASQIAKA